MLEYVRPPERILECAPNRIASFITASDAHVDEKTVRSFGEEWSRFGEFTDQDIQAAGDQYFDIVTPEMLPPGAVALDVGCGSGRWARYLAPRVGCIEAIDPGDAVYAAARLTAACGNVRVTQAGVGSMPFADASVDFAFALGVLHHVPDTAAALREMVMKLKPGGWCLLYLYYALETRGAAYRALYWLSNSLRTVVTRLPGPGKQLVCEMLAVVACAPLVGLAALVKAAFPDRAAYKSLPLSYYVGKSFYILRNDALDRFGTPLEQRFTRKQIEAMMRAAGLCDIRFSEGAPYWHAVGRRA